jgi:hypothetical protein
VVLVPIFFSPLVIASEPTPGTAGRVEQAGAPAAPPAGESPSPAPGEAGEPAEHSEEDLAKKLQNPVADLISLPFQSNFDFGLGTEEAFRYTLNIQPVVPISLGKDWLLISRTIFPIVYQEELFEASADKFGLGDTTQSFFFSPKSTEPFIWGLGPAFLIPTATDELLGGEKWGAGPTAVALKQLGPWTFGMLSNHIWSFAGDDNRAVPVQLGASQVLKLGKQPISLALFGRYWAEGPDTAPDWGIRFVFTLLLPEG